MSSSVTTTKTIRIKNETNEYFKHKKLNRAVDSLADLLKNGQLLFDDNALSIGCVHQTEPQNKDYESICEMADLLRVTTDELLKAVNELLESGKLYYSNGQLINETYEELEEVCQKRGIDIEGIIYKVIRDIENG